MAGDETTAYGGAHGAADRWVGGLNMALLNGKFYPIFALLFGLGLHLFTRAAARRGERPGPLLARRLLVLLGLGALHLALIWWGDILIVYALLGLVAMLALGWSSRALGWAALALLFLSPLLSPGLALLDLLGLDASGLAVAPGLALARPSPEGMAAIYGQGTFVEMLRLRALDWLHDFTPLGGEAVTLGGLALYAAYYGQLLGLFLLGIWAGRAGLPARLLEQRRWTWRLWWTAVAAAAVLTGLRNAGPGLASLLYYPQSEALALGYVAGFALLFPALRRRLTAVEAAVGAVGRLSLTAYLAHTTLASLLLYGTGLGLYGRIGGAALLPAALGCYALVAWGCLAWSRRFRHGPAEWVWRSLFHGAPQAMRRG
jgi:uncharacterized protein